MILSGHQPCYLPGVQLFNKIALSDVFMHCGHLQYQPGEWHSHNFIRSVSGGDDGEIIVPIKKPHNCAIRDAKIAGTYWREKHLKRIYFAYKKHPYFDKYFPGLEKILTTTDDGWSLDTLNRNLINQIVEWLEIKTKIVDSAQWHFEGDAVQKIIAMCRAVGATEYLSNEGAKAYIHYPHEQQMQDAGITHRWQNFIHPVYGQDLAINQGRLSVIDLLFKFDLGARPIVEHCGGIDGMGR